MKYSNVSSAAAVAAFIGGTLFVAPVVAHDGDNDSDGDKVSETRDLATFSKVVVRGSGDVNISVGEAQNVEVTTKSNYISRVETEVRGDTLYITQEGKHWRNVEVTLDINVKDLDGVTVQGSGDFDITNIDSDSFDILIQGSGDVDASGKSSSYDVEIQGSGDVNLSGACNTMDLEVEGSGDVEARDLQCEDVDLVIDGSGDVDVYASNSLLVKIDGSGDVTVYGDPDRFRPSMSGSGSINFADDK